MTATNKYSLNEYLDFVLNWFAQDLKDFTIGDLTPRKKVTSKQVLQSVVRKYPELDNNEFIYHFEIILNKLYADDLVDREKNLDYHAQDPSEFIYSIKFEGVEFKSKGGYVKKAKREKTEAFWKKVENLPKRYWFISLFLVTQAYNVNDLVKDVSKYLSHQPKKETSVKSPTLGTSRNR